MENHRPKLSTVHMHTHLLCQVMRILKVMRAVALLIKNLPVMWEIWV